MFKQYVSKLTKSALLVAGIICAASTSQATTLGANQTYDVDGGFYLNFSGDGTTYVFEGTYQNGATLTTGAQNGNSLATVGSNGSITFVIKENGIQVGTASGTLNTQWSNVAWNSANNVAAGDLGQVSGGGLFFNVTGTLKGQNFNTTAAMEQKFAHVTAGQYGGTYDNVVSLFGNDFSLALGNIGVNNTDAFKAWLMGNSVILGKNYVLNGDIHAHLSQVPEPATVGLLSMGLLGGALRRKRQE